MQNQSFDLHELGVCRLDFFHFLLHLQIIVHTFLSNSIALFFRMRVPSLGKQIPVIVRQQIRFGLGNYLRTMSHARHTPVEIGLRKKSFAFQWSHCDFS